MTGKHYDPFDPDFCRRVIDEDFGPVVEHYFRPRIIGANRIPDHGPVIMAPNHSGNAFPYDGMVLDGELWRRGGMRAERKFRSVFEKELTVTWWMRPYGLDNFWRRCGGVDMTFDNFDRLLCRGETVIYYPEGVPGIGKGFHRRYQLQRFSSSFVIMAARHGAPVVPTYIINAEWSIPFSFTIKPLDWLLQKTLHIPFLPLPAGIIAVLWPWAWYLSLPSRLVFVIGEPIDVAGMVRDAGITDLDNPDRAAMRKIADDVRDRMQPELTRYVKKYGRYPYQWRSLRRSLARARRKGILARVLPTGWVAAFSRLQRDQYRPPARNRLHAVLRDWDLIGYYLPLGWPLLALTRKYRKPPCGYRGMDPATRREVEGSFVWKLSERPLPPRV